MKSSLENNAIIYKKLEAIQERADLLEKIQALIETKAPQLIEVFYTKLLAIPEARNYLDHDVVNKRLLSNLTAWLLGLFVDVRGPFDTFISRQVHIGQVHSRINLPTNLVDFGMSLLKKEISNCLVECYHENQIIIDLLLICNDVLDLCHTIINETYLSNMSMDRNNTEQFKSQVVGSHFALECERLKYSVLEWLFTVTKVLYQGDLVEMKKLIPLQQSDFGLWVLFKGELLFLDQQALQYVRSQIEVIDISLKNGIRLREEGISENFNYLIDELQQHVKLIIWLLTVMVEQSISLESGRDSLTRLLNRRHLQTIMKREVEISQRHGFTFAVVLISTDNFKVINENFGNNASNLVLKQIGELILSSVRASDFVFRYGGEEFLVLLSHTLPEKALEVAERMRLVVESSPFHLDNDQVIHVTVSCGVSIYDGHPDYSKVISKADDAANDAKMAGKNRCVLK